MKIFVRFATLITAIALTASCGTASSSPATVAAKSSSAELIEVTVTVGVDSGVDRVVQVPLGASVRVTLTNPGTADEFHLHGYDIDSGEIAAGQAAVFEFDATQAGSFEIESHSSEQVLVVLQIS